MGLMWRGNECRVQEYLAMRDKNTSCALDWAVDGGPDVAQHRADIVGELLTKLEGKLYVVIP